MDIYLKNKMNVSVRRGLLIAETDIPRGAGFCAVNQFVNIPGGVLATTITAERDNRIAVPNSQNLQAFMGVSAKNVKKSPAPQWVEYYEPGSSCDVFCPIAVNLGKTVTAMTNAFSGAFALEGQPGKGSAIALNNVEVANSKTQENVVVHTSLDLSATFTQSTKTITKTGAFTNAAPGDKVLIFGGLANNGDGGAQAGTYSVVTATANAITISSEITTGGAPFTSAAGVVAFTCYRGTPKLLVKLLDGPQSGLVEAISPMAMGTEVSRGGTTHFFSKTTTSPSADFVINVYNPPADISKKCFVLTGAIATGTPQRAISLMPQSQNIVRPTHVLLNTFGMKDDKDCCLLTWGGTKWLLQGIGTAS